MGFSTVGLLLLLFFCLSECRKKTKLHPMNYEVVAQEHIGIDLLPGLEETTFVSKRSQHVWSFTSGSQALVTSPNIFDDLNGTLTVHAQTKQSKKGKVPILSIMSRNDINQLIVWLEITVHPRKSTVDILLQNNELQTERVQWQPTHSIGKKWFELMIHIDTRKSVVGISDNNGNKFGAVLSKGINLQLPTNVLMYVGGSALPFSHGFVGLMKRLELIMPGIASFSSLHSEDKNKTVLRKRGAIRKPGQSSQTKSHSSVINHITTNITNEMHNPLPENQQTIDQLEKAIQLCQSETSSMMNLLSNLRQSLSEIQQRVLVLESCECIPNCLSTNGNYYKTGDVWEEDGCLTCSCSKGHISCNRSQNCGNADESRYCESSPCENGGTCREINNGYVCQCLEGFHGGRCEHIDHCYINICQNGGSCTVYGSAYRCQCQLGYSGTHCEVEDFCAHQTCRNGGICINTDHGHICECHVGFTGSSCEFQDSCLSSPCENNGICEIKINGTANGFHCLCPHGFVGSRCETADSCADEPCMNGALCTNTVNGFECSCQPLYTGLLCETYNACHSSPCLNGGLCELSFGVNGNGYHCVCPPTHVGLLCQSINHCISEPCMHNGLCTNMETNFACRCRGTHYGDRCQHANYCRANPCHNEGVCSNTPLNQRQQFTCACKSGYTGSVCEIVDFCTSNPCLNEGTCSVSGLGFVCECQQPYMGQRCEDLNYCSPNPCLNGGMCRNLPSGYKCRCPRSHHGKRCHLLNPCRNNPCENGGVCSSGRSGSYTCECPSTHYGTQCQLIDSCFSNPCLNGGTCFRVEEDFVCVCTKGFSEKTCSSSNLCNSFSCFNGGTCATVNGSATCLCPSTHRGNHCQFSCNICLESVNSGKACNADAARSTNAQRWYFDGVSQTCQQFTFKGCGGNANNFNSRQECRKRCMVGACCLVRRSNFIEFESSCRKRSISQCKRINTERNSDFQVVSFKSGEQCSQTTCGHTETCLFGGSEYEAGSVIPGACGHECSCGPDGNLLCPCTNPSTRREIRHITSMEMKKFHTAVKSLKMTELDGGGNVWDVFRDEYANRSPLAQSPHYFLTWNRAFLKKLEMLLQKSDCDVFIPFFDFTLDAGKFYESVVWQPNYFGGEGTCIPDHPFRVFHENTATPWEPCLSRHFNRSVKIPSIVDIAMAMETDSVLELSSNLLHIVSYVKAFIGGDMSRTSCAYDPLFYSIHAFIDYLYMEWQKNKTAAETGLSHIIPLGFSNDFIWSGACTTYLYSEVSEICNKTDFSDNFGPDGYNMYGFNADGFNRRGYDHDGFNVLGIDRYGRQDRRNLFVYNGYNAEGYNRSGYDRRGFNRFGYRQGYNRDGYNANGFNFQGFNRYGLDVNGYDANGFNIYGVSTTGRLDHSDYFDQDTGFSDCCFTRDGFTVSGLDRFGFTASGYNQNGCNYYFKGPHVMYFRQKLWKILSVQPASFLMTLSRNCGKLQGLPASYADHNWGRPSSVLFELQTTTSSNSTLSQRFCVDVDVLLTWCPCLDGTYPAICYTNPCHKLHCQLHPAAKCHINFCGYTCTSEFYLNGRRVNCEDPCTSDPCLNGGTCHPSPYSSASERFYCDCPAEYVGSLCEQLAVDTCTLPKMAGSCNNFVERWHFSYESNACTSFQYSGCGGNANNFPNIQACQLRCSVGACCYKKVTNMSQLIGFDMYGFDKYGFNPQGYNRAGQKRSPYNSMPYGNQILGHKGFGIDGYNIHGYNENGFDRQGYDRDGFHGETGYNRTGFNRQREYDQLTGYDVNGYDRNGFDRSGYSCNGLDRNGYNQLGLYESYSYQCQSLSVDECQSISHPYEVVSFSPGSTCDEVNCGRHCGCELNGKTYRIGETVNLNCQTCKCTLAGSMNCVCRKLSRRKEIRDLTPGELHKYSSALQKVYLSGQWDYYVSVHSQHMKSANGGSMSLPWHRYYLASVERELRKHSDCDVSIPYFDWTIDAGSLDASYVWSVKYFGGNGQDETNCVRYHSFGDSNIWQPCIRRQFNVSVSLPDAVDLQILLHESDYESFRVQLETVSALFHLWVGGHMLSPFSPYDPLYLSHWAFMDLLWTEWQMKNPAGLPRFPILHRYQMLEPFDVTPDDVLSTRTQICVDYVSPTIGSPCNKTSNRPSLIRNMDGFDRHGYDINGYDVEGYNASGQDRQGNRDERNVFDQYGYLSNGYGRSGFDPEGWDRFGFTSLDIDRDGIDIEGYDQSGFNQFGFDRNHRSAFGMFRNGTYDATVDVGYVASLFDDFGYNKYGFNKYGLDHKGFNAFGYNANGLDRDRCNYFASGPHYMRYFYFASKQLKNLQPKYLYHVKRICQPVTFIPRWMAQSWLGDWRLVQMHQNAWINKRIHDPSWKRRTSSVTDKSLWIPITPDEQFCFDLQWYSGCPLGMPVVECEEDLCSQSRCASNQQAQCKTKACGTCYPQFFNGSSGENIVCYGCIDNLGNIYSEGATWSKPCEVCVCQGGMIACARKPCPSISCTHPVLESGQCCESCSKCLFNGTTYRNGDYFRHGKCEACRCLHGSITCTTTNNRCPPTPCRNPVTADGECCPSCPTSCGEHTEGQQWFSSDCQFCSCTNSTVNCAALVCPPVECSHPLRVDCCPVCTGCNVNGRNLRNGQQFSDGCSRCLCTLGNVNCVSQQCPPLRCQRQTTPHGTCCPVCEEGCEYEGRFYLNGESFHPSGSSCRNCTCVNNEVQCRGTACLSLGSCPHPEMDEGNCCPTCRGCTYNDHVYRNQQAWTSEDGCSRCICDQGNVECIAISQCQSYCNSGLRISGQCCEDCSMCWYKSKVYHDGEEFVDNTDICRKCACMSGNITCVAERCVKLSCSNQQVPSGKCCPECQPCFYDGVYHSEGTTWRLADNPCTSCSCSDGRIQCQAERCPSVACDNPMVVSDSCCQTCNGCSFEGANYFNGDAVKSTDCKDCVCNMGTVLCTPKQCATLSCQSQVTLPGNCCPSCVTCTYEDRQYSEGSEYFSTRNPCLKCLCQMGETSCHRIDSDCPVLSCSHPGRVRNECCRKCDMCEYERRNYRNGETFNPPHSSLCLSCSCVDGSVTCNMDTCQAITCSNPSIKAGHCCPTCTVCDVDGVLYKSGSTWFPDSCTTCTCDDGEVICQLNNCATPNCTHPSSVAGKCCPSCEQCSFENRIFENLQQFTHPANPCKQCTCQFGSVTCMQQQCVPLDCENAFTNDGQCCPSCPTTCRITRALTINAGQVALHPDDSCMSCSCIDGKAACTRLCNSPAPCSHPTDGLCCRDSCDGCFYRGQHYENGQNFHHGRNPCRVCQCNTGNVRCYRKRCPPLSCKEPVLMEGHCCARCEEASNHCTYNGTNHDHLEQFIDGCKICTCNNGEVHCRPKRCPSFKCSYPRTESCCRHCNGCFINGIEYHNGEEVQNYNRQACTTCRCLWGNVTCEPIVCPSPSCSHPVDGECCPHCSGCLYLGVMYEDGLQFRPSNDGCQDCVCRRGSVSCQRELCLDTSCSHPVTDQESCCPICGSACMLNGLTYEDGYVFDEPANHCRNCLCSKGSIQCDTKTCMEATCRNPVMGDCNCSVCNDCMYNGVLRQNRETFTNPADEQCSECYCQDGNVVCGQPPCPSSTCTHPTLDVCGCPVCEDCLYFSERYNNSSQFPDVESTCNVCSCEDGNVECRNEECLVAPCNNPSIDGCGCPFCLHCQYMGIEYENNEMFIDTMNKCNQCTCQMGTVHCVHVVCPPVQCPEPAIPIGECCPRCIGTCLMNGETIENGALVTSTADPCSECSCSFGSIRCVQHHCGTTCSHPLPENGCCPDCSGCFYMNRRYENGQLFVPQNNYCEQCNCRQGNVVCHEMQCQSLSCSNPQPVTGECCPRCPQALTNSCYHNGYTHEPGTQWIKRDVDECRECVCTSSGLTKCITMTCDSTCSHPVPVLDRCCPVCGSCFYNNQTYAAGQLFHPDSCHDCICNQGSVHCVVKACKPIHCPQNMQFHSNDNCCPKCASCIADGNFYIDGQVWNIPSNPCLSCQCHGGVVTCRSESCHAACHVTLQIPNVCCPACAGCHHNHQVYDVGDSFEPNPMNPCEICECIAGEDNSPTLVCKQLLCPSLADCPRSCVSQPQAGACCPYCADECSFGNCNQAVVGLKMPSPEDACLVCECNPNSTWVCSPLTCPHLDCPLSEQYVPKNSCCKVCDQCYLSVENRKVATGERWRVNECLSCHCSHGTINCKEEECSNRICASPTVPYKQAGQCCEECVDPNLGCLYEGHSVASRHQWLVDKCTTCHCFAGKVDCVTKICRMLMCNSDEVATVVPGECCPRCIATPGTCIAFGDPHFRTFDGRLVTFQGTCKYLLTADCRFGDFRVEVQNSDRGGRFGKATWIHNVFILVSGHRIMLNDVYGVSINGTILPHLPFLLKPHLFIDQSGSHILVNTEIGLFVIWDPNQRHLQVNVPSGYKRKTCGLCGNFNNYPQDDLRMQNSRIAPDDVTFGNEWKVNTRNSTLCRDATPFDPCTERTYRQRKHANELCKIIKSNTFATCHQLISPNLYFRACVHDVCACGQNEQSCLCDALEAYAAQCRKSGVIVNWRSRLCHIQCPTERGYVFDECGSPCKRTCANRNLPPNVVSEQCYLPCVSGCQCPAGKVEHHGRCINPNDCPEYIASVQTIE